MGGAAGRHDRSHAGIRRIRRRLFVRRRHGIHAEQRGVQIRHPAIRCGGGRLILSFGGASGTYLEAACSETDMYNLIKNLLDTHNVRAIDFDVEGSQLSNTQLNTTPQQRDQAPAAELSGLYVSFTLPVLPYLNQWERPWPAGQRRYSLLQGAVQSGVNISMVNIMAMDYGGAYDSQQTDGRSGDLGRQRKPLPS